jgi:gliding motility-associated-like protein
VPLIHLSSPFVCSGSSITLNGLGGETYQWVDQKGYMYFTPSLTLVPLVQNALTLTVTDFRGCSERTNVVVPVKELPTGYLTSDHFSDCVPFSAHVKFVATNNHTLNAFNWQMGRLRFSSDFTHTFVTAGQYTVSGIITDDQGCKNATSLFINAYDKPLAKIKIVGDSVIENIAPVVLSSVSDDVYGIIRYQWYENTNLLSEEKSFSHLYDVSGKYPITLIVQNQFNCYDTVSKIVTISPDFAVYVPNAFTPTEDRLNETFQPVVRGVKLFRLWIYDRYGHEVFTSMDPLLGWDGTRGGVECEQGTYTWKIVVTSMEGEKKEMVGGVLLLR